MYADVTKKKLQTKTFKFGHGKLTTRVRFNKDKIFRFALQMLIIMDKKIIYYRSLQIKWFFVLLYYDLKGVEVCGIRDETI